MIQECILNGKSNWMSSVVPLLLRILIDAIMLLYDSRTLLLLFVIVLCRCIFTTLCDDIGGQNRLLEDTSTVVCMYYLVYS